MSERGWSEKDLIRRAKRRLAVLQHAEEVSGSGLTPAGWSRLSESPAAQ